MTGAVMGTSCEELAPFLLCCGVDDTQRERGRQEPAELSGAGYH